jgi:hypothetical protein
MIMAIWDGCSAGEVLRDVTLRSLGKSPMTPEEICADNTLGGAHPHRGNVTRILEYLVQHRIVRDPKNSRDTADSGKYSLADERYAWPPKAKDLKWLGERPPKMRTALFGDPQISLPYGR